MSKRSAPALVLLLIETFLLTVVPYAAGGGAGVNLEISITKADTVGVRIELGGFPHDKCSAWVQKGHKRRPLPPVWTGGRGGARWSWMIAGNVGPGKWTFSAQCWGQGETHHVRRTFYADGGIGPSSRGLWIPHSIHATRVTRSIDPNGNGGGGEGSLYPAGQCTWWVAMHRQDLPFFPGKSGDALNWGKSAAAGGFPVGEVPTVGAVAVFQPDQYGAGTYGHVALVTRVRGGRITISEANFRSRTHHDKRTIPWTGLEFIYKKTIPGPAPQIRLLAPAANAIMQGTVPLSAASNARAVRFEAFSYRLPSRRASGHWETIGEDRTSNDGFTASWNSTLIPNQGGPTGSSVVVAAVALDANGNSTSSSTARVNIANFLVQNGQIYFPYYVVGTCETQQCGLHLRSGPGYSEYPITGTKYDNEEVDVVCQAHGEQYVASTGSSSDIWDKLLSGDWVSDFFVDTPELGAFSPPLPVCP